MNKRNGIRRLFLTVCLLNLAVIVGPGRSWSASLSPNAAPTAPALLQEMVGTWSVQEWMWPAPGAQAITLPQAIANRRLVGNLILQEEMTAVPGSKNTFTRLANFNFNSVNRQYEYFSIDTRAPQMMNERSAGTVSNPDDRHPIPLYGGEFVAPQWGNAENVPFRYRLVVGQVVKDHQTVELFLTRLSGKESPEFLGFKYVYSRKN